MPRASFSGIPIAVRTWDGEVSPVLQADAAEAQIFFSSNKSNSSLPSMNWKLMLQLPGSLFVRLPFKRQYGIPLCNLRIK